MVLYWKLWITLACYNQDSVIWPELQLNKAEDSKFQDFCSFLLSLIELSKCGLCLRFLSGLYLYLSAFKCLPAGLSTSLLPTPSFFTDSSFFQSVHSTNRASVHSSSGSPSAMVLNFQKSYHYSPPCTKKCQKCLG